MKKILLILTLSVHLFSLDDYDLIDLAYQNGLKPVPTNFESLVSILQTTPQELSKEKIVLGKKLFFEKELSLHKDISCFTCHDFTKGGADAKPAAIGDRSQKNPFHLNTPTVLNTAFSKRYFWNGRSETLQDQAKGPLQAPFEMAITPKLAQERISAKKAYREMFYDSYGTKEVTFDKIADAISAYEKTLVTRGRYDDFLLGFVSSLTIKEKAGLELFITKGCVGCHNGIGLGGQVMRKFPLVYHRIWSISKPANIKTVQKRYSYLLKEITNRHFQTDAQRWKYLESSLGKKNLQLLQEGFFHSIDATKLVKVMSSTACATCHEATTNSVKKSLAQELAFPFKNVGGFLGAEDKRYFRVPLLRNVVQTKPYFHNGSVDKLEEAVKIMGRHQSRAALTDEQIDTIIEFLKAVDSKTFITPQ